MRNATAISIIFIFFRQISSVIIFFYKLLQNVVSMGLLGDIVGFCSKEGSDNKKSGKMLRQSKGEQQSYDNSKRTTEKKPEVTKKKHNLAKGVPRDEVAQIHRRSNDSNPSAADVSWRGMPTNSESSTSGDVSNTSSAQLCVNSNAGFIKGSTDAVQGHIPTDYEEKNLKKIQEIYQKCVEFEEKIKTFSDVPESDRFFYIDENLQRNIEKLDRIESEDSPLLSREIKNVIKYIYSLIEKLETKAKKIEAIKLKEEERKIKEMIDAIMKKIERYDEEVKSILDVEKCKELYYDLQEDIEKLKSINRKCTENLWGKIKSCSDCVTYVMQKLVNKGRDIEHKKRRAAVQTSETQLDDNGQITVCDIQVANEVRETIHIYPVTKASYEVTVLNKIRDIQTQSNELNTMIETFSDLPGSEKYNYISSSLQKFINELNTLDTRDSIQQRTITIMAIDSMINKLKTKAKENHTIKYTALAESINDGAYTEDQTKATDKNKEAYQQIIAYDSHSQSNEIGNKHTLAKNLKENNYVENKCAQSTSSNTKYPQEGSKMDQDIYEGKIMKQVREIFKNCNELDKHIDSFSDVAESQSFHLIRENLHENIQKLDGIDRRNSVKLVEIVKDVIGYIYNVIKKLEAKAKDNEQIILKKEEMQISNSVNEILEQTERYDKAIDSVFVIKRYDSIYLDLKEKKTKLNNIHTRNRENLAKELKHCWDYIHSVMQKILALHQINDILEQSNKIREKCEYILDSPDSEKYYCGGEHLQKLIDELNAIDTRDSESLIYKRNNVIKHIKCMNKELRSMFGGVYTEDQPIGTTESNNNAIEQTAANPDHNHSEEIEIETTVTKIVEEKNYDILENTDIKGAQGSSFIYEKEISNIEQDNYEVEILKQIHEILKKSEELDQKINSFSDILDSQPYYFIHEHLNRNIQKLDGIDRRNSAKLLEKIKSVVIYIYNVIEKLEKKAKNNEQNMLKEEMLVLELVKEIVNATKHYDKEVNSVYDIARYQVIYLDLKHKKEILNTIDTRNRKNLVKEIKYSSDYIHSVMKNIELLHQIDDMLELSNKMIKQIESFSDIPDSKGYYIIYRNLQELIDKLKSIDTGDSESLRDERNNAIKYIYNVIDKLRVKAKENEKIKLNEQNTATQNTSENVSKDQVVTQSVHTVTNLEAKAIDKEMTSISKEGIANKQTLNSDVEYTREQDTASNDYMVKVLNIVEEITNEAKHIEGKIGKLLDYEEVQQLCNILKKYTQDLRTIDARGNGLLTQKLDDGYDYILSVERKLVAAAEGNQSSDQAASVLVERANIGEYTKYVKDEQRTENKVRGQETSLPSSEQIMQNVYKIEACSRDLHEQVKLFSGIAGSEEYNYIAEELQRNLASLREIDASNSTFLKGRIKLSITYIHSIMKNLEQKAKVKVSEEKNRSGGSNKYEKTIRQFENSRDDATKEYIVTKDELTVSNNIRSTVGSEQIVQEPVLYDSEINLKIINDILRSTNELNANISSFSDVVDSDEFVSIDSHLEKNIDMLNNIDHAPLGKKIKEYISYIDGVKYKLRLKAEENKRANLRQQSSMVHTLGNNISKENGNEQTTSGFRHREDSVEDISRGVQGIALEDPTFQQLKDCLRNCEQINKDIDSFDDIPRSHKYHCLSTYIQRNLDVLNGVDTGDDEFLRQEKEYAIRRTYKAKVELEKRAKKNQQRIFYKSTSV